MAGYDGYGMPDMAGTFARLGQLGDIYDKAKISGAREQSLAALGQGASLSDVAKALMRAGDIQGALPLATLAETQAQHRLAQTNSDRSFGLQQQQFAQSKTASDRSFDLQKQTLEGGKVPAGFTITPEGNLQPKQGGPADPAYLKQANEAKIGSGLLDTDTIDQMAQQYRAGDTSVLTNLGRGAQGAENIKALRQEIVRQNTQAGSGGAEQAMRNAEFFGVKSGQRTLGTKQANIELASTEFQQVLPVVQKASLAVNRTSYPDLNKIIMAAEKKTGDPNVVAFGGGVNSLVNIYARAISPSGVGTVSDKEHAREILGAAWSQGQFDAATGMMMAEIAAAKASPEKVRDEMRERFLSGQGGPKAGETPKAAGPVAPKMGEVRDGYRYKGGDPANPESWIFQRAQ